MLNQNELYKILQTLSVGEDIDIAINRLLDSYNPLITKYSMVNGKIDEDLKSELKIAMINCINTFIKRSCF